MGQETGEMPAETIEGEIADLLRDMLSFLFAEFEGRPYVVDVLRGEKHVTFVIKPGEGKATGLILGRRGQMAKALRVFLAAAGRVNGRVFHMDVITNNLPKRPPT